jgi:hypothetical protein
MLETGGIAGTLRRRDIDCPMDKSEEFFLSLAPTINFWCWNHMVDGSRGGFSDHTLRWASDSWDRPFIDVMCMVCYNHYRLYEKKMPELFAKYREILRQV